MHAPQLSLGEYFRLGGVEGGIAPLFPHPEHQNSMGEALPLFVPDDSVEHFAANFHVTCGGAP